MTFMKKITGAVCLVMLLILPVMSYAQGKIEHPRFMKEYASYVIERLDHEADIRKELRKFIDHHRAKLTEGLGYHPELLPEMFRITGAERLNCISGKYYEDFFLELNNEERHTFYDAAQAFSWWTVCLAVEEMDNMNVKKLNPPLSFRQHTDNPFYIKQDLKETLSPYLKESGRGTKDFSFNGLKCDDR